MDKAERKRRVARMLRKLLTGVEHIEAPDMTASNVTHDVIYASKRYRNPMTGRSK